MIVKFFSLVIPIFLSVVGLFLSLWVVVPAPNFALLPLGVGAPEISPWLVVVNAIAFLLVYLQRSKGWLYLVALGLSVVGLILSSLPLTQLPSTITRFSTEMQTRLGTNWDKPQVELQAKLRLQPFVLADAFRGISSGKLRSQLGIVFATPDDIPLTLNVYHPEKVGKHPTLIMIYGGAWRTGSPNDNEAFSHYLAAQGYTIITVSYRHAPQFRYPSQLLDVQAAIAYIQQHADELEVDVDRVAIMGRSAGAHLAMLAAYQSSSLPIRAVVNYYGPVDLIRGYNEPPFPDPIDTRQVLRDFLGGTPTDLPALYRQASPLTYVVRSLPPTLLIYGDRDHLVQSKFGKALYDQLQKTGTTAVWLNIPWAEHAFDAVFNGVSNQLALYYTERFLAWALGVGVRD